MKNQMMERQTIAQLHVHIQSLTSAMELQEKVKSMTMALEKLGDTVDGPEQEAWERVDGLHDVWPGGGTTYSLLRTPFLTISCSKVGVLDYLYAFDNSRTWAPFSRE